MTPTTELRGRLTGPRCRFASTVEVAYPLRPFAQLPANFAAPSARVVIPEASLWDPQSPFLYHGQIELWQDGRLCHRVMVSHGLRALTLGPRGLSVNGRPFVLRGRSVSTLTEDEALALRVAGVNLLVVPVGTATAPLCELADRIGFLVLGEIAAADAASISAVEAVESAAHASCVGWLVRSGDVARVSCRGLLAVRADGPIPPGVDFVVGEATVPRSELPLLLRGGTADGDGVFGSIV